jgi:hypothetical protein
MWKAHGVTHAAHQRTIVNGVWFSWTSTFTECGRLLPNLPWRNTQRFSLQRVDCMACVAAMATP